MKVKIFPILFLITIQSGKLFSQDNRDAILKGYQSKYEYVYFDSINKLSSYELNNFKNSFSFYITFRVDTNSVVTEFEIIEIPGLQLPVPIKTYIEKLIKSSNGLWSPQIKNSKKVVSDEFIYQMDLMKKDQSFEDRVRDSQPIFDYFYASTNKIDKIEKIVSSNKKRLMPLSY